MGGKEKYRMYRFVPESESKRYRSDCLHILKKTCASLRQKNIVTQFSLVGSGTRKRNMITRNGDGPFDLDYNLEIIKATDEYWNNLRYLKDTIRVTLDQAEGLTCFSNSQDSTSCLTALLYFKDTPNVKFSFDVAIVKRNAKGKLCRLVHNKNIWGFGYDQYVWDEVPNSHDVSEKVAQIKSSGLWLEVRDRYIHLKNLYLSCPRDKDHPSFAVYIEAVNQIYNQYFCNRQ